MPFGFNYKSKQKHIIKFINDFKNNYGKNPGFIEAVAFDTAMIVFKTVSQPNIKSRKAIINSLLKLRNFNGVTGFTSFSKTGDAQKKAYLLQIKVDKFVHLEK